METIFSLKNERGIDVHINKFINLDLDFISQVRGVEIVSRDKLIKDIQDKNLDIKDVVHVGRMDTLRVDLDLTPWYLIVVRHQYGNDREYYLILAQADLKRDDVLSLPFQGVVK